MALVSSRGEQGERGEQGKRGLPVGAPRAIAGLFVITLAMFGLNLLFTAREVSDLRHAVQASCHFAADIGGVPIQVNLKTGRAPLLGVKIVSDSRVQWHGLGCPGHLVPPARSFVHWAKVYRLPYR